jgi:hypothetical protein
MFDGIQYSSDSTLEAHTECHILRSYFLLCGVDRDKVLTAVFTESTVFCGTTSCCLVEMYQRFGVTCSLQLLPPAVRIAAKLLSDHVAAYLSRLIIPLS